MVRESVRVCQSLCIPIPIPIPSKSLGLGGGCQSRQKKKQTPTHTVTEIRGHCGEGGRGWGLSSSLFSIKKTANFGKAWNPWKIVIFPRKLPLRLASDSKKNCAYAQSSFEFPIPRAISSKFSRKRMSQSLIPISSGFKELTIADRRYIHLQLAV